MWAVIGLAGSYGVSKTGGLQVVTNLQHAKPTSRNLEIVLDASGSMKLPLGTSTRWQTALGVLEQVMSSVPDDFNVGLRVYGHRYASTRHRRAATASSSSRSSSSIASAFSRLPDVINRKARHRSSDLCCRRWTI